MSVKRNGGRGTSEARSIFLSSGYVKNANGSCFVKLGNTQIICAATVEESVPRFLKNSGKGWISAEYGMLPCSANGRIEREAVKGGQSGRTHEIQRLIGRSLRSVVDLKKLGERQIKIDCDVIQADGGTRTAGITGAFVALYEAMQNLYSRRKILDFPISGFISAISCGIFNGEVLLDLDYEEDSKADVDGNFVIDDFGNMVEAQLTAEKKPFTKAEFDKMHEYAAIGCASLIKTQKEALGIKN